jgi:AraC-like DNA-binding protein
MIDRITSKDFPYAVIKATTPKTRYVRHTHQEHEINLIFSGKGRYILQEKKEIRFREGDIILFPAGSLHDIRIESELSFGILLFHPETVSSCFPGLLEDPTIKSVSNINTPALPKVLVSPAYYRIFNDLYEQALFELANKSVYFEENLKNIFSLVALNFVRLYHASFENEIADPVLQRILNAKMWIDINFEKKIKVSMLAELAHMSESHFLAKFKEYTGQSPIAYLKEVRIHKACELLAQVHLNIIEIAYSVGISELSNFNHYFRDLKGCTPSEYRKNHQSNHRI